MYILLFYYGCTDLVLGSDICPHLIKTPGMVDQIIRLTRGFNPITACCLSHSLQASAVSVQHNGVWRLTVAGFTCS